MPSKSSTAVALRFPNDVILQLDALAASRSCSRPEAIRFAVEAGLGVLGQSTSQERKKPRAAKPQSSESAEAPRSTKGKKGRAKPGAVTASSETEADLVTFAVEVLAAAQHTKTGRFGDDRVFISHVWRQFKREHKPEGMDLEAFKKQLVEANRERLLSLVCADLAPTLNQKDVKESETRYLTATFHFLCL